MDIQEKTNNADAAPANSGISSSQLTALAIIFAGLFIAVAIIYTKGGGTQAFPDRQPTSVNISSVSKDDHILGSIDAPIKILEFSDTECPFCKMFHGTMKQIVAQYGDKVAWVYRHLPLESLHTKALKEAEATECAAELGGNGAFWSYIDRLFEVTPSNNGLDLAELPKIAEQVGLNVEHFKECLASGKYAGRVGGQAREAFDIGINSTPHSFLIAKDGRAIPIKGARDYSYVSGFIDVLLAF